MNNYLKRLIGAGLLPLMLCVGCSSSSESASASAPETTESDVHPEDLTETKTAQNDQASLDVVFANTVEENGKDVLRIAVSIKNLSTQKFEISPEDFQLVYSDAEHPALPVDSSDSDIHNLAQQELAPDEVASGYVLFDATDEPLQSLVFSAPNGQTLTVNLNQAVK